MAGPAIPTGYESLEASILQKRKIAQALLEQGMSPRSNMRSPLEVVAQLAQAWAGKSIDKDANKMQAQLIQQRIGDYSRAATGLAQDASAANGNIDPVIAKYAGNPILQDNPVLKALIEARGAGWTKGQENTADFTNDQRYRQAPTQMTGPDGKPMTVQFDKTGNAPAAVAGGLTLPREMSNINGVAIDLQAQPSGTLLPADPEALLNHTGAPNSDFTPNPTAIAAKTAVAAAGAARQNATFVNTGESEYGKKIGGSLGDADAAAIAAAREAPNQYQTAQRVMDLLGKNPITGTGAELRLGINKALATIGVTGSGKTDATQVLAATLAKGTLSNIKSSGLGSGNGFTDKDRQFLQDASSGSINMTPGALMRLAQLNQRSAIQSREAGKRVLTRMRGNPATANLVEGFGNELDTPLTGGSAGGGSSVADRARRILEQRRRNGGR